MNRLRLPGTWGQLSDLLIEVNKRQKTCPAPEDAQRALAFDHALLHLDAAEDAILRKLDRLRRDEVIGIRFGGEVR